MNLPSNIIGIHGLGGMVINYDILQYLGDLGGLLDIVLLIGAFLTSMFVGKLFTGALIS